MTRRQLDSILILLAFLAPTFLAAQRQIFHEYGFSDGLINLNVRCLLQDPTGYVWVGTDNGLFRYDGAKFRGFGHSDGLSNTEITSLAESPSGTVWVGTNDGVAVLSGEHFQSLNIGQQGATHRIGFDSVGNVYLENDSGIILGVPGNSGVYQFQLAVSGSVSGLFVNGGEVLFGRDGGLWRLSGNKAVRFSRSIGLPGDWYRG